jgi:hypothetical protein
MEVSSVRDIGTMNDERGMMNKKTESGNQKSGVRRSAKTPLILIPVF